CREPLPGSRRHLAQTVELPRPVGETETPRSTPQSSFDVVRGLAEKAFALGKRDDAERLLRPQLESLLALAQSKGELDDALFSAAAQAALRLVDQGPATRWIDWLFAFHESASRLMSLEIIDGLYEKARKVGYADPRPAHAYVASLAAAARDYGPAERFRLKRIEGLVRVLRGGSLDRARQRAAHRRDPRAALRGRWERRPRRASEGRRLRRHRGRRHRRLARGRPRASDGARTRLLEGARRSGPRGDRDSRPRPVSG